MSTITLDTTNTTDTEGSGTTSPETVVVGYDGSEAAQAALRFAMRHAAPGGRIVVIHAYKLPPTTLSYPEYGRVLAQNHTTGELLLEELPVRHPQPDEPHRETELIGGPAARAIAGAAHMHEADEIVIGIDERDSDCGPVGNLTRELLRIATCPVVLVAVGDGDPPA